MNQLLNIAEPPPQVYSAHGAQKTEGFAEGREFKKLVGELLKKGKPSAQVPTEEQTETAGSAQQTLGMLGLIPIILPELPANPLQDEFLTSLPQPVSMADGIIPAAETIAAGQALELAPEPPAAIAQQAEAFTASRELSVSKGEQEQADSTIPWNTQQNSEKISQTHLKTVSESEPAQGERPEKPASEKSAVSSAEISQVSNPATRIMHTEKPAEQPQNSRSISAEAQDFPVKMAEKIIEAQTAPGREIQIELYPRHLGKVTVSVSIDGSKATVSLVCENEKAQSLLNSHAESIRSIIQSSTGYTAAASIEKAEPETGPHNNFEGHNRENQQNQRQQQPRRGKEETVSFIQKLRLGLA